MTREEMKLIEVHILGWNDPEPWIAEGQEPTIEHAFQVVEAIFDRHRWALCLKQQGDTGEWSAAFRCLFYPSYLDHVAPSPKRAVFCAAIKVAQRIAAEKAL